MCVRYYTSKCIFLTTHIFTLCDSHKLGVHSLMFKMFCFYSFITLKSSSNILGYKQRPIDYCLFTDLKLITLGYGMGLLTTSYIYLKIK